MSFQNDFERVLDLMQREQITAAQANVKLVRIQRYRLISGRVPQDVRKALNEAVRSGELGHMKKAGRAPECYYHPTFVYMARDARRKHEVQILQSLLAVCA